LQWPVGGLDTGRKDSSTSQVCSHILNIADDTASGNISPSVALTGP